MSDFYDIDLCVANVPEFAGIQANSKFALVLLAKRRVMQLFHGASPLIVSGGSKHTVVALKEIAAHPELSRFLAQYQGNAENGDDLGDFAGVVAGDDGFAKFRAMELGEYGETNDGVSGGSGSSGGGSGGEGLVDNSGGAPVVRSAGFTGDHGIGGYVDGIDIGDIGDIGDGGENDEGFVGGADQFDSYVAGSFGGTDEDEDGLMKDIGFEFQDMDGVVISEEDDSNLK